MPAKGSQPSSSGASRASVGADRAGRRSRATSGAAGAVAELIRESRFCIALTGAGISVPSGIPDFRSPGRGLWERVDPMKVAHIDAFRDDPEQFWRFYSERFLGLADVEPNPAHYALARLEHEGYLRAVITQNIDRLHRRAGSRRVIEVHGSIDRCVCLVCGEARGYAEVLELLRDAELVPRCRRCREPLKPDVVLFGELLPEAALREAEDLARTADLMLCIGSSLEVWPVAGLPRQTLLSGGRIVVVTQGPTPYDGEATVKLDGDVVNELDAVLSAL